MLEQNQKDALELLKIATGGRFIFWHLAGRHNAGFRQTILSKLTGAKLPKTACGVTRIQEEFYKLGSFKGSCGAHTERNFIEFARHNS